MPADLSFLAWLWLVIPAAVGLLVMWVITLEVRQIYRNLRACILGGIK
jgi:hypothetical protein